MTALLSRDATQTWTIGAGRLLAGLVEHDVLDLTTHLGVHGALPAPDLERLLQLLDISGLTGRGGAGFPFATKLRSLRGERATVVVNGSESEPASAKDRMLMRRAPHLVLDGALAIADAVHARSVVVAVHDGAAADSLARAVGQRTDARRVRIQRVAGGFVAGEARALLRGLARHPALPPGRRSLPTHDGMFVSNVETFAQVAVLVRTGARGYASTGTRDEPGTTLLTVGGAVTRPGVVEIPTGTPLSIVLHAAGAERTSFVVAGGYHGGWLRPDGTERLSRAGLAAAGTTLGAGIVLAVDDRTCALGELAAAAGWLAAQSARQCGPCRFGLPALAADVAALTGGHPLAPVHAARHAALVTGRGACTHPDGASRFVTSGLRVLGDEIVAHAAGGCGRPVLGRLPVGSAR